MLGDSLRCTDLKADDLDEVVDVRSRSFGVLPKAAQENWKQEAEAFITARRFLGVLDGDRVIAAARIWDLEQWWVGRRVPMGGVAGVVVAPEYRGRGVGTQLMRGVLERCRELGLAISALYPNSLPAYRKVGFEIGGARYRFTFPAWALRTIGDKGVPVRRGGPEDAPHLMDMAARQRERSVESGLLAWPERVVRDWLAEDGTFCYLAEDGFVVYRWDDSDLSVDELVAGSPATARALWATVGSGSSVARQVHAYIAPHDPIHLLLGEEAERAASVQRWMLRLVDAPAAIAARGWASGTELDLPINLVDADLTANSGTWRLQVSDGEGRLVTATGDGPALRLTARGLAALYAGTPTAALRIAGLVDGGSTGADDALDAAFATSTPFSLDFF